MDELLDIVGPDGVTALGVKARSAVHRDGDWHVAFHLWVVRADGVLLQHRSPGKDSWPDRLDATAAGHLVAGETVRDGLREVEEELGVAYAFETLADLGVHRVDEAGGPGRHNREHQHVFGVRDERPLEAWTDFDRVELAGLALVGHDAFAVLAGGGGPVTARAWDGVTVRGRSVSGRDVVPSPYLAAIAPALVRLGRGG